MLVLTTFGEGTDVLRLMAAGLSNAEVAVDMFLGVQTVRTHVAAVLRELGARDRTGAVVIAYESGLSGAGQAPPGWHRDGPGTLR